MSKFFNFILKPLCWIGIHPMRSRTGKGKSIVRCDRCGRFVKGGA